MAKTDPGVSVENVDVLSSVEVIDSSFSVDLKGVLRRGESVRREIRPAIGIHRLTSSILMLTVPHCRGKSVSIHSSIPSSRERARTQMSSLDVSSKTIRLSLGERPVFFPEKLMSAPEEARTAPSYLMASS